MSKSPGEPAQEPAATPQAPRPGLESGIVRKDAEDRDEVPPWRVVALYLARGDHAAWVEGYAARSRAFADVLEALRTDREERVAVRRGTVLRFRRG